MTLEQTIRELVSQTHGWFAKDRASGLVPMGKRQVQQRDDNGTSFPFVDTPDQFRWIESWDDERSSYLSKLGSRLRGFAAASIQGRLSGLPDWVIAKPVAFAAVSHDLLGSYWSDNDIETATQDYLLEGLIHFQVMYGVVGVQLHEQRSMTGFTLFAPTDEQRNRLIHPFSFDQFQPHLMQSNFLIATTAKIPIDQAQTPLRWAEHAPVLHALRLATRYDLWISYPFYKAVVYPGGFISGFIDNLTQQGWYRGCGGPHADREINLDDRRFEVVQKLVEVIQPPIATALTRLERASSRIVSLDSDESTDALVDLFVVLESVISSSNEKSEIIHRIAQRAARLVSRPDERPGVYKDIKKLYDERSKAVHGSSTTKISRDDIVRLGELARIVVGRALLLQSENLPKLIDNALLGDTQASATIDETSLSGEIFSLSETKHYEPGRPRSA